MNSYSVQIIGGGPGGLYLALLLRRQLPSWQVTVHDTTPPAQTFGFGVGFTPSTLKGLADADPESHAAILAAAHPNPRAEFRVPQGTAPVRLPGNVAIERTTLLTLLADRAQDAGAQLVWSSQAAAEDFRELGQIVVAADGAGSATRQQLDEQLGARVELGRGLYLWCGADVALPRSIYAVAQTEHGMFVAHAYPYGADRSTFLIETDQDTWERSGLAAAASAVPPGDTDVESLRLLQAAFADVLGPATLIGNRTQWRRFRTVTLDQWHYDDVVLLGDAAHTAHYSVGSGTKMAMQDSIALASALACESDTRTAFTRYEAARRQPVKRLQQLARRSQDWWESFPERAHLPAEQLALAFLTRTGNVRLDGVQTHDPMVLRSAARALGAHDDSCEAIVSTRLSHPRRVIEGRLLGPAANRLPTACPITGINQAFAARTAPAYIEVRELADVPSARERFDQSLLGATIASVPGSAWSAEGDAAVNAARAYIAAGCDAIRLSGNDSSRPATLARLELAERVRLETGAVTVASCPPDQLDDGIAAIASGRVDLIALSDPLDG